MPWTSKETSSGNLSPFDKVDPKEPNHQKQSIDTMSAKAKIRLLGFRVTIDGLGERSAGCREQS
jgi:hypothetical protein